jgi:hypothetical protein
MCSCPPCGDDSATAVPYRVNHGDLLAIHDTNGDPPRFRRVPRQRFQDRAVKNPNGVSKVNATFF